MGNLTFFLAFLTAGALCLPSSRALCQSPYRLDPFRETVLFSAAVGTGISALLVHDATDPLTPEEVAMLSREDVNGIDRGATWNHFAAAGTASDYLVYGLVAAPAGLLFERRIRDDWQTYFVMWAEALLLAGATVQLTKGLVGRTRPYVYNPDVPVEDKTSIDARRSFYSSHTAFAFASAVFLSVTYSGYLPDSPGRPWIWAISLLAASTVGYLRYAAGEHFPTDILTGAALGVGIGYLVPVLHEVGPEDVSLTATGGSRSVAVSLVLRF